MANEQNLKTLTPKQARELGSKGGKASAKAKKQRKSMQEAAAFILSLPLSDGKLDEIASFNGMKKTITDDDGNEVEVPKNLDVQTISLLAIAAKAMKGDVQALSLLRDTAGEKPVERVEVNADVERAIAELERDVNAFMRKRNGAKRANAGTA